MHVVSFFHPLVYQPHSGIVRDQVDLDALVKSYVAVLGVKSDSDFYEGHKADFTIADVQAVKATIKMRSVGTLKSEGKLSIKVYVHRVTYGRAVNMNYR